MAPPFPLMPPPLHNLCDPNRAGTHAYVLVGATATGKSAVAHYIAERYGMGILSADSMLVYRGMDIGTAKPTVAERGQVPYWGLDLVSPADSFSAGAYLHHARKALEAAAAARRPLVVAGGTGLYVSGLLRGFDPPDAPPPEIREQVRGWFQDEGREGLARRLCDLAPDRFAALSDPQNPRRLMRALELHLTGVEFSPARDEPPAPCLVGLRMDRTALAERIRLRVRDMYAAGLLKEAARLRTDYPCISVTAREAIGYAEAFGVLDGEISQDQAVDRTAARTRQLAKRQTTWFQRQLRVTWIDLSPATGVAEAAAGVVREWERKGPAPVWMETDHGA